MDSRKRADELWAESRRCARKAEIAAIIAIVFAVTGLALQLLSLVLRSW